MSAEVAHGTLSGYTNGGCRCELCRAALAAYKADLRRRKREGGAVRVYRSTRERRHGARWLYSEGCRCEECVAAEAAYKEQRKAAALR